MVEVPITKIVQGKKKVVDTQKGVVRLEKGKSPKGNEYWRVAEIFNVNVTSGLKVGNTSPLDMSSFPQWLRESAELYFVKDGKDFVKRKKKF